MRPRRGSNIAPNASRTWYRLTSRSGDSSGVPRRRRPKEHRRRQNLLSCVCSELTEWWDSPVVPGTEITKDGSLGSKL